MMIMLHFLSLPALIKNKYIVYIILFLYILKNLSLKLVQITHLITPNPHDTYPEDYSSANSSITCYTPAPNEHVCSTTTIGTCSCLLSLITMIISSLCGVTSSHAIFIIKTMLGFFSLFLWPMILGLITLSK